MIKLLRRLGQRTARLLTFAALLATMTVGAMPGSASADNWQGNDNYGQLVSINTWPTETMCLQSVPPGADSRQGLCSNYSSSSFWHTQRLSNGHYLIKSYTSGGFLCLTVDVSSYSLPQKVTNGSCTTGANSKEWIIDWTAYGFMLHPAGGIWDWGIGGWGKCLDVFSFSHSEGGLVALWNCNGQPNQRWRFTGLWQ